MRKITFCIIVMTLLLTSLSHDTYANEPQKEQFFDSQKKSKHF